jgi:hypothetical protein
MSSISKFAVAVAATWICTQAAATTVVIAVDNSSSTKDQRKEVMRACAVQFAEVMRTDNKINRVHFMTIGSAKNHGEKSEMKRVGPRDFGEYLTLDHLIEHFQNRIRSVSSQMAKGKIREDGSSAIWTGVFQYAVPLLGANIGDKPEEKSVLLVCSDFIENEVLRDVTKQKLPKPERDSLKGVRVYGVGFGLGLDAIQQDMMRKNWQEAMRIAGAKFTPMTR